MPSDSANSRAASVGLEWRAGHAFGQELGVGATQPRQLDLGEPLAAEQSGHQLADRMLGIELLSACGGSDEDRRFGSARRR